MKRFLAFTLVTVLTFSLLTACTVNVDKESDGGSNTPSGSTTALGGNDNPSNTPDDNGDGNNYNGDSDNNSGNEKNYSWPKNMMGDIPELKGEEYLSQVVGDPNTASGIMIGYDEVSQDEYRSYVEELKALGYETVQESEAGIIWSYEGSNGDYFISLQCMFVNDDGTGGLIISYGKS